MGNTLPIEFKKKFFILFTRELIINSEKKEILKLQDIIEKKRNINPVNLPNENVNIQQNLTPSQINGEIKKKLVFQKSSPPPSSLIQISKRTINPTQKRILVIPEPTLPKHLEYLKPIPSIKSEKIEIDLGKLNPLLKDPAVKVIEGNPDEVVYVSGTMGTQATRIVLTKEEIDEIIKKFSAISKIPIIEGIYRVVAGNLILSAIISEVVGSRFVIKKLPPVTQPVQQQIIPANNNPQIKKNYPVAGQPSIFS